MEQYKALIQELINKYDETKTINADRTGVGTVKVVGRHLRFDLAKGFPLLTLKKTAWKPMLAELLWFLKGSTDNNELVAMGCNIWTPWAVREKDIITYAMRTVSLPDQYHAIAEILIDEAYYLRFEEESTEAGIKEILATSDRVDWSIVETETDEEAFWECRHPNYDTLVLDKMIDQQLVNENCREMLGQLGPIYGASWTALNDVRVIHNSMLPVAYADGFEDLNFMDEGSDGARVVGRTINQIADALHLLRTNPNSRRNKVSAWEPRNLPNESISPQQNVLEGRACLAFCHDNFQFVTEELSHDERCALAHPGESVWVNEEYLENAEIPTHKLNCLVSIRKQNCGLSM